MDLSYLLMIAELKYVQNVFVSTNSLSNFVWENHVGFYPTTKSAHIERASPPHVTGCVAFFCHD